MNNSDDQMRSDFMKKVFAASGRSTSIHDEMQKESENQKITSNPAVKKKAFSLWLNPAAIQQFKTLAAKLGMTQDAAIADALNLLFKRHGEPEIA